jgi:sarcosine oxidase
MRFQIPHEILTPDEVAARFPAFRLDGDETCYYEPTAGVLRPEACIAAQLDRARTLGAVVRVGEAMVRLSADVNGVTVDTDRASYSAAHVIVSAGAWLPALLGGTLRAAALANQFRVYAQSLFWFAPDDPIAFGPERFPIFIWRHGTSDDAHFYGFPDLEQGMKLASETFAEPTTADAARAAPSAADAAEFLTRHVNGRLTGVGHRLVRTATCLYTVTPDFGFIVDRHPDWHRVWLVSACSGHGFKHSAAIGEAVAQRVIEGATRLDVRPFAVERLGRGGGRQ